MDKRYTVYKLTCPNGKCYIGMTCREPEKRWENGRGYKSVPFGKAILEFGWENIDKEILCVSNIKENAENKERYFISKYMSNNEMFGYNIESGGTLGKTLSNKTKAKISETLKRKGIVPPSRKGAESEKRKPVLQYDANGKLIAEYCSQQEASISMGVSLMSISNAVNGKIKTCKGYVLKRKVV